MSWIFNPPPGWPPQPDGWVPPPGWAPDPRWPPAPAGWQFWVPGGTAAPVAASAPVPPYQEPPGQPAPYPATQTGPYLAPADPYPPAQTTAPYSPAQGGAYPPAQTTAPYSPAQGGAYPAAQAGPHPPGPAGAAGGRPWFTRWWVIAGLIALLVIGSAIGFGGTRVALELQSDDEPARTGGAGRLEGGPVSGPEPGVQATPVASELPAPTRSPWITLPAVSPPAVAGVDGELCADVALIMITMVTATAEVDASAQLVEDEPGDQASFEESFDRVSDAYQSFTDDNC